MRERLPAVAAFLIDLERLKLVPRKAYVSDLSRRENSAEHSWHLAMGLLTLARELDLKIDLHKALIMALIHDTCEIDAGDTPAYGPARDDQHEAELACIERLSSHGIKFGEDLRALWLEYEAQESAESRWVKVLDRGGTGAGPSIRRYLGLIALRLKYLRIDAPAPSHRHLHTNHQALKELA